MDLSKGEVGRPGHKVRRSLEVGDKKDGTLD